MKKEEEEGDLRRRDEGDEVSGEMMKTQAAIENVTRTNEEWQAFDRLIIQAKGR